MRIAQLNQNNDPFCLFKPKGKLRMRINTMSTELITQNNLKSFIFAEKKSN